MINDIEGQPGSSKQLLFGGSFYHFLLVVCSNYRHVTILHCVRDATTFTAYVTGCDLEKSFAFDASFKIIVPVRASAF